MSYVEKQNAEQCYAERQVTQRKTKTPSRPLGDILGGFMHDVRQLKNKDSNPQEAPGSVQLKIPEENIVAPLGRQNAEEGEKTPNNTGLPDNIKAGAENLSGFSLDDVKVHYSSDKPAQLNAAAFAQGSDIHVAAGQEKHLPHEVWHVVQQKQWRVRPALQLKNGVNINADRDLENEADVMGAEISRGGAKFFSGEKVNGAGLVQRQGVSSTRQLLSLLEDDEDHPDKEKYINIVTPLPPKDKIELVNFLTGEINENELQSEALKSNDATFAPNELLESKLKYYEAITTGDINLKDYWINWPAYATGDLPSMSAAILMGFKHGIRIQNGNNGGGAVTAESKVAEVCSYIGGVQDQKDKQYIINEDGWKATCGRAATEDSLKFSWLTRVVATGEYKDEKNNKGEKLAKGGGFDSEDMARTRRTWLNIEQNEDKSEKWDDIDRAISGWLTKRGIDLAEITDKNVIVLWIRKSGEKGGAHYENDSSFNALSYYIQSSSGYTFILAGDDKQGKAQKLADYFAGKKTVINLTEFWKDDTKLWEDNPVASWGGDTRTGQFRLYDYIKRHNKSCKHIGSMSGGLEALALLGHDVEFKAKEGEVGVKRMDQYAGSSLNKVNYTRISFQGMPHAARMSESRCYDYDGFEKLSAKYYVFFSSGVIQGNPDRAALRLLYENEYDPQKIYKVKDTGLNGENAKTAREVSKELAREEREKERTRARQRLEDAKKCQRNMNKMIQEGNPNRQTTPRGKQKQQRKNSTTNKQNGKPARRRG